jgi:photosystem II stability/assembly factor-like uncharacterized protein
MLGQRNLAGGNAPMIGAGRFSPTMRRYWHATATVALVLALLTGGLLRPTAADAMTPGWQTQNPGTSAQLRAVAAVPGNLDIVWAVGDSTILKTANGGATWNAQTLPTRLYGMAAASETTAWAVGYASQIRKTIDGTSWQSESPDTFRSSTESRPCRADCGRSSGWLGSTAPS